MISEPRGVGDNRELLELGFVADLIWKVRSINEMKPEHSLYNLADYPKEFLRILTNAVSIPVTYKKSWDDGFGARGWKLDVTIGDPVIIASTRETGEQINTSVFVHDILDHLLSGFAVSGHRSEAMALIQLSKRTKSNPKPDYEQMIKEDILHGRVNGETLMSFLPDKLKCLLPLASDMTDKEIMTFLKDHVGEQNLISILVEHFFSLGESGDAHATNSWQSSGLNPNKKRETGLALQSIFEIMDATTEKENIDMLKGAIQITDQKVSFDLIGTRIPASLNDLAATID